jgi:hypothetical protein
VFLSPASRYYDGRNAVSRVLKGEIKISANDVQVQYNPTLDSYVHYLGYGTGVAAKLTLSCWCGSWFGGRPYVTTCTRAKDNEHWRCE